MSIWILVALIAVTWLLYPFAGAAEVQLGVLEGKRPKGAGFTCIPELLVFPAAFFVVALVIDYFAMPYGRWIVAGICVLMLALQGYTLLRSALRIRKLKQHAKSNNDKADSSHADGSKA